MKIGLCLAGGGASGGAHVGVIRALEEAGISIAVLTGTSSGAMVAGLYAAGLSTARMLELLPTLTRRHIDVDLLVLWRMFKRDRRGGFIKGNRLHAFLCDALQDRHISDVHTALAIVATDLQTGREVVFSSQACPSPRHAWGEEAETTLWDEVSEVPLALAIRASISIPFVFQPVRIDHMVLADGGLIDNCPVMPARALGADFVIAADTITPFLLRRTPLPLRARVLLQQVVNIGLARHAVLAAQTADVFLTPPVGPIGALDFARLATVAEKGYEYTRARIPAILKTLETKERQLATR